MSKLNDKANAGARTQKFIITPKGYILMVLFFITGIAGLHTTAYSGFINAGAAITTAVILDLIGGMLIKRKRMLPDGAIITALIVSLVLSANVSWIIAASTTAIAIASKFILQIKKKPIFNPAAFGLLMAILFFSTQQDWWGGFSSFPAWCIGYVLIGGYLVTSRSNKFPQAFAFLTLYFSLFLAMALWHMEDVNEVFRVPFINSALFLAFFMVTDPPTSPGKYRDQIIFGAIVAIVSVTINIQFGGLSYLLVGLLAANLCHAVYSAQKKKYSKTRLN
ncbi:MAG: RnfABCDGE type electron transport complex subunit D [Paenibacillaceae bacterium]